VIPEQFRHIFHGDAESEMEFAGMANSSNTSEELGMLAVDCGASTTITKSLFNMTDVKPKVVIINLAMDGLTMKSTHVGIKTYYIYDRTGTIRPIKTRALYVKECQQDLLGGTALTNSNYRVVLDSDNDVAGVYPKAKDGSIDPANSFSFVSEYSESLFYLRTAPICATKYAKMSGYELLGYGIDD
jgi:hypothetical protein